MSDLRITAQHIHQARELHGGFCVTGIRAWCNQHGIDFRTLLQEGYPIETIAAIGDVFSEKVVAVARGGGS